MTEGSNVSPSASTRARGHMPTSGPVSRGFPTAVRVMALGIASASFANEVSWESASAGGLLVVTAAGIVYGTRWYRQVTREFESTTYTAGSRGRGSVLRQPS